MEVGPRVGEVTRFGGVTSCAYYPSYVHLTYHVKVIKVK